MSSQSERRPGSTRVAASGMVLVLAALAVFATWSNLSASRAAARVARATDLLASYDRARFDLVQEDSLDRKYRLEQSRSVLTENIAVGQDLLTTLRRLAIDDPRQRRDLIRLVALHQTYATAMVNVVAAADAGDAARASRLDDTTADPVLGVLEAGIFTHVNDQTAVTDATIADLRAAERIILFATPPAFACGLLVLVLFLRISGSYQRTIELRAMRDALTGLPNRECFYDRGTQALLGEERRATSTSVLVIDLDRFKELNDTLGHRFGDELLCQIGSRLSPVLRQSDTLARLGGDEFAILLPDSGSPAAAHEVAERLLARLREPFVLDTFVYTIDASCGHATSPDDGNDIDALLQHADVAMYIGKATHGDAVAYNAALDVNTPRRLAILSDLAQAIHQDELVLHYQPKTDVATREVVGAEALLRWDHPTLGLIPPDDFIPAAEHSGLIKPLTRWVLDAALDQCRRWNETTEPSARHPALTVAVNVSARSLIDANFPVEVREALHRHAVSASLLTLEVTETAIMADPARAHLVLQDLHNLGVKLSIDDFGTGYSSLSYLKLLPVSEVKIDRSFVKHMNQDLNDETIVRSVIDLAHNLGMATVAEGIEDQATLDRLDDLGCDLAQGYHVGRPMSAEAFEVWLIRAMGRSAESVQT